VTAAIDISSLTFGSVCSGIEAASVAWHPLGWRACWFSEIDRAASEVLAYRFPDTPNHGDMLALAGKVRRREIAAPDILVGGTPCQSFSVAGLRKGLSDARGQLTIAFIDLADAIDEVRAADGLPPVIIVWENVPGVLTHKDNPFGCFLAGLAGEADALVPAGRKWTNAGAVLGPERAIAWRVIDAQYLGLAQRRRRVFVVAGALRGSIPPQYFLSSTACAGILRRAETRGKALPEPLMRALMAVASQEPMERAAGTSCPLRWRLITIIALLV
jgi:DNA (cytosine-5)-methyltransferase 1